MYLTTLINPSWKLIQSVPYKVNMVCMWRDKVGQLIYNCAHMQENGSFCILCELKWSRPTFDGKVVSKWVHDLPSVR